MIETTYVNGVPWTLFGVSTEMILPWGTFIMLQ
jgi:hypothetical protein